MCHVDNRKRMHHAISPTFIEILLGRRSFLQCPHKGQDSNNRLYRSLGSSPAINLNFLVHLSSTYFCVWEKMVWFLFLPQVLEYFLWLVTLRLSCHLMSCPMILYNGVAALNQCHISKATSSLTFSYFLLSRM